MRYIVEGQDDTIREVTNLFNCLGQETKNLAEADVCVIKVSDNDWRTMEVDGLEIYTVH